MRAFGTTVRLRVLVAVALVLASSGLYVHMRHARERVASAEQQLAAVHALLGTHGRAPAWITKGGGLSMQAMETAIEAAAQRAGIASASVARISAAEPAELESGGLACRVALRSVAAEQIVDFVYHLEVEEGLRVVRLDLNRQEGREGLWRCDLTVAAAM